MPTPLKTSRREHVAKRDSGLLVLITCIAASALAMIDGSVVNVGLPAIGASLKAPGAGLAWVINGFALPLSALILTGGAVGDRFGRRVTLLCGVALFASASVVCALSPDLDVLVGGRLLQGAGAAFLMPNSLAILGARFEGEAKGRAIGIWAASTAAGAAVAPLLGGWLIDALGWRSIFFLTAPPAALCFVLAVLFVHDSSDDARPALDVAGAALASLALTAFTFGLTDASMKKQLGPLASMAFLVGLLAAAAYVWVERRKGERAMTPLSMFSSRRFTGLTVLTLLLYGALGAVLVLVPYLLQEAKGFRATAAGAALLPLPLVLAVASPVVGGVAGRIGSRWPLTIGPCIVACGFLGAGLAPQGGSYWTTLLPQLLVISVGMSLAVAPLTTAVLSSVESAHTGTASGFNSAVARTGGLIATALMSVILSARGGVLIAEFRIACLIAAACAFAAAGAAFLGLKDEGRKDGRTEPICRRVGWDEI